MDRYVGQSRMFVYLTLIGLSALMFTLAWFFSGSLSGVWLNLGTEMVGGIAIFYLIDNFYGRRVRLSEEVDLRIQQLQRAISDALLAVMRVDALIPEFREPERLRASGQAGEVVDEFTDRLLTIGAFRGRAKEFLALFSEGRCQELLQSRDDVLEFVHKIKILMEATDRYEYLTENAVLFSQGLRYVETVHTPDRTLEFDPGEFYREVLKKWLALQGN